METYNDLDNTKMDDVLTTSEEGKIDTSGSDSETPTPKPNSNTKLNELYRLVSGHTLVDFGTIINNLKEMPIENRLNYIGKYLYSVPGGIGNNYIGSQFRSELYKTLGENSIFLTPDINKDSNINQEDYYRIILEQIDINNDNQFTVDDIEILKLLSTEPISEELGDGKENGHYYVDLGLPSGTMWATCNIGADKVTDH